MCLVYILLFTMTSGVISTIKAMLARLRCRSQQLKKIARKLLLGISVQIASEIEYSRLKLLGIS